jgi:aspartyl-tRNA(Asn)/glutamyl-tRNA(Gln) amidotransferase subunit C
MKRRMKVTPEELRVTAKLARLEVGDDQAERVLQALEAILGYVEKLAEVDVSHVEPMAHAVAISLRLRDDEVGAQLSAQEALSGVPRKQGTYIEVPRVIEHDKEAS